MVGADTALTQISTALGASWASGINIYAAMLSMGLMHVSGVVVLPEGLHYLAHPFVLFAAGLMFATEFFTDKMPGVDTMWDGLHTFIRIPGGIIMAYGAAEGMGEVSQIAMAILGGGIATTSHAFKAGSRVLINTSPEPLTNIGASTTEDASVIGGIWLALSHPIVFLGLLAAFMLAMIWLMPKIWRGVKRVFKVLSNIFRGKGAKEIYPEQSNDNALPPIEHDNK